MTCSIGAMIWRVGGTMVGQSSVTKKGVDLAARPLCLVVASCAADCLSPLRLGDRLRRDSQRLRFLGRTPDLLRLRPLEAGAILERGHAETSAEDDPHPVRRPETALEGDSLQRPVACFQHHARRVNAGARDKFMRRYPGRLHEMPGQIARAHAHDWRM